MSADRQHSNKSAHLVEELRKRFLEDCDNNPGLYNEDDVERIRTNDWYVKRFLLARRRNVDEAYEMIRNTMRWRQEFGLPTMKDQDFPIEFYKVGGIFPYEKDKDGNVVIYLRIRMHRKIPEMAEPVKKFLMHIVNKTDKEVDGNGMAIVFDCSGAGYSNMDMDFLTFLITAGNSYFPVGLKYILVYELSWLLNAFRRVAMSLIPQSFLPLIKFANKDNVMNYIPLENLPDFMGGHCTRNYRHIPEGCTTVAKVAIDNGFTQADIDRILPIFEPLLEEADKAIAEWNSRHPSEEEERFDSIIVSEVNSNSNETIEEPEVETIKSVVPMTANNSVVAKTRKQLSRIVGIFPDDVLYLNFEPHSKTYQCNILLQNLSDKAIAYKIQSNNPSNYRVSPRLGVILVGASLRCNIQLIANRRHEERDKFMIMAQKLDGDHRLSANQFARLWTDFADRVHSHKLLTNICEHYDQTSDESHKELMQEVNGLRRRCDRLEGRQRTMCLLLNALLVVICALTVLVVVNNSYDSCEQPLTLVKKSLLSFKPKNMFSGEL